MHVKQLTEERERLKLDFEEENIELKNKINALEREMAMKNNKIRRIKSDTSITSEGKFKDFYLTRFLPK